MFWARRGVRRCSARRCWGARTTLAPSWRSRTSGSALTRPTSARQVRGALSWAYCLPACLCTARDREAGGPKHFSLTQQRSIGNGAPVGGARAPPVARRACERTPFLAAHAFRRAQAPWRRAWASTPPPPSRPSPWCARQICASAWTPRRGRGTAPGCGIRRLAAQRHASQTHDSNRANRPTRAK